VREVPPMKIVHYEQIAPDDAGETGAEGVAVRWVITDRDGADNFSMRVISVRPGGHTPYHDHPWEHEVFVLRGHGMIVHGAGEVGCAPGDVVFIPPSERHQFRNPTDELLEFICLIPNAR
jgi:quercetin dioxygenase-like cupin family protein